MFLEERQQQICALLDRDGRVAVSDLAQRFSVTEDCIRKDLKQLAAEGACRRVYGGATRIERAEEHDVISRRDLHQPEKQLIARKAIELIAPRETVFLDISTTTLCLARLIASSGLVCTVISPMIDILSTVAASPAANAICPGGAMRSDLNGFVGALAIDALCRFRFDVAFVGAYGIDVESHDVSTFDADDGLLKRAAIERSARGYLVCESRKFGAFGTYRFASLEDVTALICDGEDTCGIRPLRDAGITVI